MEYLIKKILKEFVEGKVKFKVIDNISNTINEEITNLQLNLGREINNRRLKRINPFVGKFIDKKTGKERNISFNILPSNHYLKRLYRTDDPEYMLGSNKYDPKIVNPTALEGIDLIYNNRNKLAEQILIGRIKDGDVVEVTAADGSNYHVIVKFDESTNDMSTYNLHLLTQIKGVDFYNKKYQKKLNLYPNPKN